MDNIQIGCLIRSLRAEKRMTQHQLAEQIGVTDQAVSKWERGLGSPDISLLADLSRILGVNIEKILAGDLQPNDNDRGNMKRIRFYVCPDCGLRGNSQYHGRSRNILLRPKTLCVRA